MGFLHTIDIAGETAADENLLEVAASLVVVEPVNGEDLPALHIGQTEDGLDVVKTLLEPSLVKQDGDIRVVDDGLLHDGTADDVLKLLGDDTYRGPELSCSLVHILDVPCHNG